MYPYSGFASTSKSMKLAIDILRDLNFIQSVEPDNHKVENQRDAIITLGHLSGINAGR